MKRLLLTPVVTAAGFLALVLLVTALVEADLWVSGVLGLHKQIGTSSQSTENYASVSGHLPVLVAILGFSGILATAWKRWNCHEPGCWRHGKYEIEGGVRVCDPHHPASGHKGPATRLHVAHLEHLKRHA